MYFWFDVHVTVHRDKFLTINQLDALISQIYFRRKLYMFRIVSLSIIRSFSQHIQQWYVSYLKIVSYRFADSLRAGSGYSILILHRIEKHTSKFIRTIVHIRYLFFYVFIVFWHIYVLGGAYFVWPWKSRPPHRDIVTSQRGHWPLLIRVSGITWRSSKLLETLTLVRVTYAHVWARVAGWVGEEENHTYFYAYRLYFLTCDMYKSSLRHIHDPVLLSLKMKGILSFINPTRRLNVAEVARTT
jgi:hypothetical protein